MQESHPFGSPAQKKIAQDIRDSLVKFGLNTSIEEFTSKTPNTEDTDGKLKNTTGYNVIGFIHGSKKCEIMFGGHYDTKYLAGQQFVGANDGGSSTALLLELARVAKQTHIMKCGLYFVFFDGEESLLPNWDDGKNLYGIQDNLYGSRHFASTNKKKFSLIFILDMIGHKNQNLFITQGSNNYYANKFISAWQNNVIAIDVRDDAEFLLFKNWDFINLSVAPMNVPLHRFAAFVSSLLQEKEKYKDKKIVLLCSTGARSLAAARSMRRIGFENVWSVDGGFVFAALKKDESNFLKAS